MSFLINYETTYYPDTGNKDVRGKVSKVVYTTRPKTLKGYLCRPAGEGPFPAVSFNHGGSGKIIGGAPKET